MAKAKGANTEGGLGEQIDQFRDQLLAFKKDVRELLAASGNICEGVTKVHARLRRAMQDVERWY